MLLGGGFGRRFAPDFAVDATLLSQTQRPAGEADLQPRRRHGRGLLPARVGGAFRGCAGRAGSRTLLKVGVGSPSLMAASGFMKLPDSGVDAFALEGIVDHPYDIAHQRIHYGRAEPGPQVWFWRSVGHSQNIFFLEGFHRRTRGRRRRKDPFEFRRALLSRQPRCKAVLELAAERANWGKPLPAGVARGIALARCFGSFVAQVAEVSVAADGTPKVHRIVAAVDCGMTVNPEIVRRQIEGSIAFGLSAALYGRVTFAEAGCNSTTSTTPRCCA